MEQLHVQIGHQQQNKLEQIDCHNAETYGGTGTRSLQEEKAATGFDNIYQGTAQEQYQQEPKQTKGERDASKHKN